MATQAQNHANRKNAGKSTGPRTDEGKTKVAQNAVKHGLLAQRNVIIGEDPAEFELHRDQMLGELDPPARSVPVRACPIRLRSGQALSLPKGHPERTPYGVTTNRPNKANVQMAK